MCSQAGDWDRRGHHLRASIGHHKPPQAGVFNNSATPGMPKRSADSSGDEVQTKKVSIYVSNRVERAFDTTHRLKLTMRVNLVLP